METEEKVVVTVPVKGSDRVKALEELVSRDHSSRAGVLNKALDQMIKREGLLEDLCAGEVAHA